MSARALRVGVEHTSTTVVQEHAGRQQRLPAVQVSGGELNLFPGAVAPRVSLSGFRSFLLLSRFSRVVLLHEGYSVIAI